MTHTETFFKPGAHLLAEKDESPESWRDLIALSAELKAAREEGREKQYLRGKNIALIFEKTSTRTRAAFEVAAAHQGAHTTYLDPASSQLGHKESVADTAQVLGRFYDGIEFRGDRQQDLEILAQMSGVPVWNGLTDLWHPTQMLADSLTMLEHSGGKDFAEIQYAYVGDGRFNTGRSLLMNGSLLGADVRIVAPKDLWPDEEVVKLAEQTAQHTGAKITVTEDLSAVEGVNFVHTDVWVSMGEPFEVWRERVEQLLPYQVNDSLLAQAGEQAKFMHCLPAFHDLHTQVGRQIHQKFGLEGVEVTNSVFHSPASVVFDQAENRLHTIKAVMVRSLGQS